MKDKIKVIGFDADDTLWVNEPYYRATEKAFYALMTEYAPNVDVDHELYKIEVKNLPLYGYGAKAFTLSMIETALVLSGRKIPQSKIEEIIDLGRKLIQSPMVLLDGVVDVLDFFFCQNKRIIMATKGDLLDQERKLRNSGLEKYFHHIEIMSEKKEADYKKLLKHVDIEPGEFLMIGNSLKSDILPIVHIGGNAVYVPCDTTWQHEIVPEEELRNKHFHKVDTIKDVLALFK